MKNLVFATLIAAAASQAAGCIIFSDDDNPSGLGDIHVTWSLKSTNPTLPNNPDVVNAPCPAGATTATLFALPAGAPPSSAFQDKYDCIDGTGTIADLEPGTYTVWVQLQDTSGATKFAESFSQDVQVLSNNVTSAPTEIFVDRGFFFVGWNLSNRFQSCAQATGNDGVSIVATDGGGAMAGFDTVVDCIEGEGRKTISQPLPLRMWKPGTNGQYTVVASLLNAQQQSIGDSQVTVARGFQNFGGATEDLGILNIVVR